MSDRDNKELRYAHAMSIDDAYRVQRTLARSAEGVTELVTLDDAGPFVRKKIPRAKARRSVWALLGECTSVSLPCVQATYETPDWFAVVLGYVEGATLDAFVAQQGALPVPQAVEALRQLARAVGQLHARGVAHRDLSPQNIVVEETGKDTGGTDGALLVHVIDFGNAALFGTASEPASRDARGTWGFAAPEQYGFAPADARSDVYALGRLSGYLLTGVSPDNEQDFMQAIERVRASEPFLGVVIDRACSFEPSARYEDADAFAAALDAVVTTAGATTGAASAGVPGSPSAACTQGAAAGAGVTASASQGGGAAVSSPVPQVSPAQPTQPVHAVQPAQPASSAWHPSSKNAGRKKGFAAALAAVAVVVVAAFAAFGVTQLGGAPSDSGADSRPETVAESEPNAGGVSDSSIQNDSSPLVANRADGSATQKMPLELVESGWSISSGYVIYAVGIRNVSTEHAYWFPTLNITGLSSDGQVVFANTQVFSFINSDTTLYFAGQAGNGVAPDTVEFELQPPQDYDIEQPYDNLATCSIVSLNEPDPASLFPSFTGEVTVSDGQIPDLADSVMVSVVLRDDAGAIVGGYMTFIDNARQGTVQAFEVLASSIPDYATCEAHAVFW